MGLRLLFLPNFPGAMFIPDSRVVLVCDIDKSTFPLCENWQEREFLVQHKTEGESVKKNTVK